MTVVRGDEPGPATTDTNDGAPSDHKSRLRLGLRPAALTVAAVAGFAGLVAILYAVSVYAGAADSDKATTILVGEAIANGNLLLHGWILSPANYWTTDAAFYALAVHVFGLRPGLLYAEPAVVGALTVTAGVVIAREGRRGAAAIAGAISVVVLLVCAPPAMALWFVGKSFHIATALYALVALWLLRPGRFGWRWVLGVALLAFGLLGDLLIAPYAMAPLFIGGVVAMLRLRSWRSGMAQVIAALASFGVGEVVLRIAHHVGAFNPGAALPFARGTQLVTNLGHLFTYSADLVGLTNGRRFGTGGVPVALLEVHVAGALLIAGSFLLALARLVISVVRGSPPPGHSGVGQPELWRLDDMLVLATICSAVPFVALAGPNGVAVHLLALTVLFATVLAGRVLAALWSRLSAGWTMRAVSTAGIALCLGVAAGLGYQLALPEPPSPDAALTAWLEAHHLTSGIGDYWAAALTTVCSHGKVTIWPVTEGRHDTIERLMFQSSDSWYAGKQFQFYVYGAVSSNRADFGAAENTWGKPSHVYDVNRYQVLVWSHPVRVPGTTTT